jgi:FAD/FMN-containing dehydrogenase
MAAAGLRDAHRLVGAMRPWANGRQYLNFAERAVDPAVGFDSGAYAQLRKLRARLDPTGVFQANHVVPNYAAN